MKKRLSNFFLFLSKDSSLKIWMVILVAIWIFIFFQYAKSLGAFIPPTEKDYQWLHEQEEKVKEDMEYAYLIERASIEVQDNEIYVTLISKTDTNYELHMTFDKNRKFVKSEEICNKLGFRTYSIHPKMEKYEPIIGCIIFGFMVGGLGAVVLQMLYSAIYNTAMKLIEKNRKIS